MMIHVRPIHDNELDAFRNAVARHGALFADPAWAAIFGPRVEICGIFDQNGILFGGFLYYRGTMKGYPWFTNLPFTPSIALFYDNPAKNTSNRIGHDKEVLEAVARYFRKLTKPVHRYCLPPFVLDMQPFASRGFKVIPHLTYQIDLQSELKELQANLSAKLRNNLKKALADGIRVSPVSNNPECESLILGTYKRNDISIRPQEIRNIFQKFAHAGNSFAIAAIQDDQMIAVSFFLHNQSTAYYMFGGFHDHLKHEGAGASTIWEGILESRRRGLTVFDFEGSMIPRIEKYFRGFGGKIVPYYTINRAPFMMEVILKAFRREIF